MKYAFDHSKETVNAALGISDERMKEIVNAAELSLNGAFTGSFDKSRVSRVMEDFINRVQPVDTIEAFFTGEVFGQVYFKIKQIAHQVAE